LDTLITLSLIAGPVILALLAFALGRLRGGEARVAEPARSSNDVAEELELLRYENAVLRSEQQRPMTVGKASERIRERMAGVTGPGTDEGDEAWGALTEASVLREMILGACKDLQTAIRHVQAQLSTGVPITELDRRHNERGPRWGPTSPAAARSFAATQVSTGDGASPIRQNGT
jgi:hypothetical protein